MIDDLLTGLIRATLRERKDRHGWDDGLFADILKLSIDQRGKVGEQLIEAALRKAGVPEVTRAGKLDRTHKHWDIRTAHMDIEVKTATLGRNINTFQHESIEKDRQYHALVLLDIAPNDIYLTWLAKDGIDWRSLHRRANSNFYKLDLKLPELESRKVSTIADVLAGYNAIRRELNHDH